MIEKSEQMLIQSTFLKNHGAFYLIVIFETLQIQTNTDAKHNFRYYETFYIYFRLVIIGETEEELNTPHG